MKATREVPLELSAADSDRFWSKVDKTVQCWQWLGALDTQGYGSFTPHRGLRLRAHRISYTLAKGPIPFGLVIDHLCRNRGCVNPDHLEAVTDRINTLRGESHMAENARKSHCPLGHPYDEANTYRQPSHDLRGRVCRTCKREWEATRRGSRLCGDCGIEVLRKNFARHLRGAPHLANAARRAA